MNMDRTKAVPGGIGYTFDIIVVRLDISDKDAKQMVDKDPSALVVEATFYKEDLKITSSRINVVEFKAGKSFEFVENPSTLKDNLSKNKLNLKIKHEGKDFGVCAWDWPESFLNCLTDTTCVGELTHGFESEFKNNDTEKVLGIIEVIVRLQRKCAEWNEGDGCFLREDVCKAANKIIDPNDILFVVGEDKDACCCSQVGIIPASDSNKSLNPTCLDLSNFRAVNGQTVPNTDVLAALDPACCELKKVTNQYQKLIGSLMSQKKPTPCCTKKPVTEQQQSHRNPCECLHNLNLEPCSSSDSNNQMPPARCCSHEKAFAGENVINICRKDSVPELIEHFPIKSRCCPLCKENLSWLPKLAACPKCGYKPIPQIEERPYNDKLTANQILNDFLEDNSSCTEKPSDERLSNSNDGKASCRCTCKPNRICAHCRIKKLCGDIFLTSPTKKPEECGKCATQPSDLYKVCQTDSKDCRPYLARVFSELKELYDIPDPKKKSLEANERCETELNRGSKNKTQQNTDEQKKEKKHHKPGARREEDEMEATHALLKNCCRNSTKCRSKKAYNYRSVHKYPGTQVGHKTCINGFAGRKNVPPNMGWLWNIEATGLRAGWKPGAIRKPIKELMKYFLRDFPADTLRVSQYSYRRGDSDKGQDVELIQKPTLHICKRNGEYFITLRPLKDPEALRECADPYLNMQPIQFKIIKNPLVTEMHNLKQCLKEMGFNKCTCHKPITFCFCRSFLDKKRLEYQCSKEARKRNLPPCVDSLVLSDTTDSETEFDFGVTPPAGVVKPERLHKPHLVNTGTQYEENDWNFTPMYPKEPNKYMKLYNCAVGERFGKAFGPYGLGGYAPGALPTGGVYGSCKRGLGKGGKGANAKWNSGHGRGVKGGAAVGVKGSGGGGKVDMMKYLNKSKGPKLSPAELADKRKKRLRELSGVAPPLICMVDRRAKPFDPCQPVSCCNNVCLRDNRIC